jgi:hypothetical protein
MPEFVGGGSMSTEDIHIGNFVNMEVIESTRLIDNIFSMTAQFFLNAN